MTKTCKNCGHERWTHSKGKLCVMGDARKRNIEINGKKYGICACSKFEAEDEEEICDVCWETRKGCSCKKFTPTGMTLKKPQKGLKIIDGTPTAISKLIRENEEAENQSPQHKEASEDKPDVEPLIVKDKKYANASGSDDFCLSNLIFKCGYARSHYGCPVIHRDNIKEFIRRLKEEIDTGLRRTLWSSESVDYLLSEIDKLAGDKLK